MANKTIARKDGRATEAVEVPADEARQALGDLLDRAGFRGERFVITRHGKPLAALIGHEDLQRLLGFEAA